MKQILIYLYTIALCFFTSCNKDDRSFEEVKNPEIPTILEISQNTLSFSKNGGENIINIICDGKWAITNNGEWCSIDPKTGIGNVKIRITTKANSTENTRITEVFIQGGSLSQKLIVSQEPSIPIIQPQPETPAIIHVENAGTLSELLKENKNTIENLTLTGKLSGNDIKIIREMAKLSSLDISGASIVSGAGWYLNEDGKYYYTSENEISEKMFSNMTKLKTIVLPKNTSKIGGGAFYNCTNLISIILPNTLESIGASEHVYANGAFEKCTSLSSIIIPDNVTWMGSQTFSGCISLSSINISKSSISIGDGFLSNCSSLNTILIPNNIKKIGGYAFDGCTNLQGITIPNSVAIIEECVFRSCTSLKEFIVSTGNNNYGTIDGILFDINKKILIAYPNAKSNTYIIPNSVEEINDEAFGISLTSVTIPNGVKKIGNRTFWHCSNLKEIHIKAFTPPTVSSLNSPFHSSTCIEGILYVPKGSSAEYRSQKYWKDFQNIREE